MMARMTLRLPESLHEVINSKAKQEGVSMNQYIVYALTQVASLSSAVEQRRVFKEIVNRVPLDESEQALRTLLAEREG